MARYRRRLCLAVDLRHYSRHTYPEQQDAQYRLRLVVEHALRRARVPRVRAQQQLQGTANWSSSRRVSMWCGPSRR